MCALVNHEPLKPKKGQERLSQAAPSFSLPMLPVARDHRKPLCQPSLIPTGPPKVKIAATSSRAYNYKRLNYIANYINYI